jgi:RHS repeat-associated protein
LQDISYSYDLAGNITQVVDASDNATRKTVSYVYDDLDRLKSATAVNGASPLYTESYAYNTIGNLLTKSVSINGGASATSTYAYAGNQGSNYANPHAVTSITTGSRARTFAYDRNGNVVDDRATNSGVLDSGSIRLFNWTPNGRLASSSIVVSGATSTIGYAYDGSGQRLLSTSALSTLLTPTKTYDVTRNASGTALAYAKRLFADALQIAAVEGSGIGTSTTRYTHADHLTGATLTTSATGSIEELLDYTPYGEIRIDEKVADWSERRKFAGHEYDVGTGLSYQGARYYDPTIGRFTAQDPVFQALGDPAKLKGAAKMDQEAYLVDPQLHNSYGYARNNPLTYRDADGNIPILAVAAAYAVAYAPVWVPAAITWTSAATLAITAPLVGGQIVSYARGDYATGDQMGDMAMSVNAGAAGVISGMMSVGNMASQAASQSQRESVSDKVPGRTLQPGQYAGQSIHARGPGRDFTSAERSAIDKIGGSTGCHTCGNKIPGTSSGHFVPDHQPPSGLNVTNQPQSLYPHCINCSNTQGGQVRSEMIRKGLRK